MNKDKRIKEKAIMNSINFAFFILMACSLTACLQAPLQLLDKVQDGVETIKDSSYKTAAKSIDNYCSKVPYAQRLKLRQGVNSRTVQGDIIITCESDK